MIGARPDFVAGNTRLLARLPDLAQLDSLEPGPARRTAADQLLRAVPAAYAPPARAVVAVLLGRHDLADVIALLRGAVHSHPAAFRLVSVRAVGTVGAAAAADLAAAADGAGVVSRTVTLGLLGPALGRSLQRCWDAYELHQDLAQLENDIATAVHRSWEARLAQLGAGARPVGQLLAEERDRANLTAVLRVGTTDQVGLLPPGRLDRAALAAAARGNWTVVHRSRPDWSTALRPLGSRPDSSVVEARLQPLPTRRATASLRFGGVDTAAPAVGYTLLVEDGARRQPLSSARPPTPGARRADSAPGTVRGEPWAVSS